MKNFSFLYDDAKKAWCLSPGYDLTYSFSLNGEHATTIDGEGKEPTLENILKVAENAGIKPSYAKETALEIREKCRSLEKFFNL